MNPEFLTEGRAVADFMHPDRLVLGGMDERTHATLSELYGSMGSTPRVVVNNPTAEMIKYASNATLAAMISLANEFARFSAAVAGVDIVDVMRGVHSSQYFTSTADDGRHTTANITSFLEAGCGFGGSCLPKDVAALVAHGRELGLEMSMLGAVLQVNAGQPDEVMKLIRRHVDGLQGVPVTVLGLAFKPDTDDVRESPAFPVIRRLRDAGATISAYDPVVKDSRHPDLEGVTLAGTLENSLRSARVVVLITRWEEFTEVPAILTKLGGRTLLVDGRRMCNPHDYANYEGIGRSRSEEIR
jgi:UDPglucose 6-dehydrogenase/GDP-mannose 6-dehydrogenase